ncbi:MAG: NAD(+)--rifampin ADP-ribosyltransferase [Gemmatimonadaceae bacterium]|nr:NAD(+)--rifampin ADP-ribosyltransferase [Gemmatimonadaceae bacterium]
MGRGEPSWSPVSHENCHEVPGPFYHGTRAELRVGDLITTGHRSHFEGRALKHVYFSALVEPAIWGAELAMSLSGQVGRGFIYIVDPTGPFEDDPNLTNKRFPGNPTRSYRSTAPLRICGPVSEWEGHSAEVLQGMLDALADLRRKGMAFVDE